MSGIYSDPRYEALGLTDTTQARAADQFYGNVPMAMGPMGNYGGQFNGGFEDEDDLQVAYEKDIVSRLGALDPTAPDYEFKVQEFFANEPDPNAAGYGRVRQAASAFLGRAGVLRERAKQTQDRELQLRSQLAENGFNPQRFAEITDANGRLKLEDAYFQLGELKRTNGASGKYDPTRLSTQENEDLIKAISPLNIEPTDEEKVLAYQQFTGSSDRPETTQQWTDAYNYVMGPRKAQAQGLIRTYQQLGRAVPAGILEQAGIQPSTVSSTPASQSYISPAQLTETTEQVSTPTSSTTEATISDVTPTGVAQRTRADVMQEEEALARMTPEQRLAYNVQAPIDQARRERQQEEATMQANLEASVPMWESAKQELLTKLSTQPNLLTYGRAETIPLTQLLGKDPKATAFTDRTGQSWTWNDVTRELLNDPRVDNIRRGVAPGNQTANIKRITPK